MMELKFKKMKKRFAQQLVEFLLVAPFIIIILGIMTEYAYALYVRMVVNQGLREVTTTLYKEMKPTLSKSEIQALALKRLNEYLVANNVATQYTGTVPDADPAALKLEYVTSTDTTVFVATYKYIPAITFPQVYFHFLPERLNFMLISAVPNTFMNGNDTYIKGPSSTELDQAWQVGSFANLTDFDNWKKGVLKDSVGANNIIFLIPVTNMPPLAGKTIYALITWNGVSLRNGTSYEIANLDSSNGDLYNCDWTAAWTETLPDPDVFHPAQWTCNQSGTVKNSLSGYTNFIFVHGNNTPIDASGGSVSPAGWSAMLPKALAIVDAAGNSLGNYDNLAVNSYNTTAAPAASTYTTTVSSNKVFVYSTADNIDRLK